jgi:hydrogenase maturation factor
VSAEGCDTRRCVTCADEAVPMRVLEVRAGSPAFCADATGSCVEVLTDLVGAVRPGDLLLVHAGAAIALLPEAPG